MLANPFLYLLATLVLLKDRAGQRKYADNVLSMTSIINNSFVEA